MLIKDIIANRYAIFNRMSEEKQVAQIEAMKYIIMVSGTSGIPVMDWDAQEVFGTGKGNEIETDRRRLNMHLFNRFETIKASLPAGESSQDVEEAMKQSIEAASRAFVADQTARIENDAQHYLNRARDHQRRVDQYVASAVEKRAQLAKITGRNNFEIGRQVELVHRSALWEFGGIVDQTKIVFLTRGDVVLSYKNPAAGVDITLNFGRFKTLFNLQTGYLSVHKHERNLDCGGYYHPHIYVDASICWGNASNSALTALSKLDLVQAMALLGAVLTNYNKDGPYCSIEEFWQASLTEEERVAHEARQAQIRQEAEAARLAAIAAATPAVAPFPVDVVAAAPAAAVITADPVTATVTAIPAADFEPDEEDEDDFEEEEDEDDFEEEEDEEDHLQETVDAEAARQEAQNAERTDT